MSNPNEQMFLSIGLMSGTSMDGIDAALLETDGLNHLKELAYTSLSYDPLYKIALKAAELAVRNAKGDLTVATENYQASLRYYLEHELQHSSSSSLLHQIQTYLDNNLSLAKVIEDSTRLHARLVNQLLTEQNLSASDIRVVGYHGQTLLHRPEEGISIIIGDGQRLANEITIPVVNDFRSNDLAHKGKGAPFAPLYHLALCARDHLFPAAVVNCGGIANVTLIPNENPDQLIAFDTGPGNGLIDRLIRQRTQGKEQMDKDGHYGQQGKVNEAVLNTLFEKSIQKQNQNFFKLAPPKALDIGDLQLIQELDALTLEDACRTLEAFTAESIVQSLALTKITIPKNWILAGGGWNNPVILQELRARLTQASGTATHIQTADQVGWNGQALEAQIFAYLAVRSLKNLSLSLTGTTGVTEAVSGGRLYTPN